METEAKNFLELFKNQYWYEAEKIYRENENNNEFIQFVKENFEIDIFDFCQICSGVSLEMAKIFYQINPTKLNENIAKHVRHFEKLIYMTLLESRFSNITLEIAKWLFEISNDIIIDGGITLQKSILDNKNTMEYFLEVCNNYKIYKAVDWLLEIKKDWDNQLFEKVIKNMEEYCASISEKIQKKIEEINELQNDKEIINNLIARVKP